MACLVQLLTLLSGRGAVADAGSRYFVCRRHLPSFALPKGAALANISCLSRTTLMMPIHFVQIKTASTLRKVSAHRVELKD